MILLRSLYSSLNPLSISGSIYQCPDKTSQFNPFLSSPPPFLQRNAERGDEEMITSDSFTEKMQRCQEYVEALEEERGKIQVFQRELPLCLELITQVIDAYKQQLSGTTTEFFHGQSECSGQTSSDGPVLELLPVKRTSEDEEDDDDEEQQSRKQTHEHKNSVKDNKSNDKSSKKSDWLSSVQLWNQTSDPPTKEDTPRRVSVMEVKRNGGAFHPFKRDKSVVTTTTTTDRSPSSAPAAAASSTAETGGSAGGGGGGGGVGGSSNKEEKEGQSQRKARRCWSPELHRRFLHALQQLGGSHVATPKQIRELMKVDGLTNDEVKSHLQKYRLHTRRPTPPLQNNNSNSQAPQFVVVGGIWVPPPEYAAAVTTTAAAPGDQASGSVAASNGIYAPIAAPPPPPLPQMQSRQHKQSKQQHSDERASHSDGGGRSSSPETSSSTHTSTASPAF